MLDIYFSGEKMSKEILMSLLTSRYREASDFIIEAVRHYASLVSNSEPDKFANPLRGGRNWLSVAEEMKAKLNS